jgi:hypothetical protein
LARHAADLSVKFPELGSTLAVSLSGTLSLFSYIEAENDWTSRADGADYIEDLVWLGFKKVAQDIPRHKRAIEQTIGDAMAKFAPLGRSKGILCDHCTKTGWSLTTSHLAFPADDFGS